MKVNIKAGMKTCFNDNFKTDETRVLMIILII